MPTRSQTAWKSVPVSSWEGFIFVVLLLVQQDAFITLPIIMNADELYVMRGFENPLNSVAIIISLLLVSLLSIRHREDLIALARLNVIPVVFTVLVILSTAWSFHAEITIRRSISYVLTMLIAALLSIRLDARHFMRLLSLSFAISAVGSLLFVLVAPQYGIMSQHEDVAGCWQGVFCTKQQLGSVMAVAAFVEIYLLMRAEGQEWWRFGLLALFVALIILSRSRTHLVPLAVYTVGSFALLGWKKHYLLGVISILAAVCAVMVALTLFWFEPGVVAGGFGKDTTLTGRTDLWPFVVDLVKEKPLLGWGYRAMWQPTDAITQRIDDLVGFAVPSSHNALLEIALELGLVGVGLIVLFVVVALYRGIGRFRATGDTLGWFLVLFVVGCLLCGLTTETLGRNQLIEWVVLNALFFSCGLLPRPAAEPELSTAS